LRIFVNRIEDQLNKNRFKKNLSLLWASKFVRILLAKITFSVYCNAIVYLHFL